MRARAASTSAATRREVEQSIARFEKRLDDANDALQSLGKNLGRGAQSSYKEVTSALRALRRDAAKTNKQALKDFDKLRQTLTAAKASSSSRSPRSTARSNSGTTRSGARSTSRGAASRSSGTRSTASRSSGSASRSSGSRSTSSRSTSSRSTSSRSTAGRSTRSRAKKS